MLLVKCQTLKCRVEGTTRITVLEKLQEQGLAPLIGSARTKSYELSLHGTERVMELEKFVVQEAATEGMMPYLPGDVFCFEDFFLFLIFDDEEGEIAEIRAGIIYQAERTNPYPELEEFCRKVSSVFMDTLGFNLAADDGDLEFNSWQLYIPPVSAGFTRFVSQWEWSARWEGITAEQERALELLDDREVRMFLKRVKHSQADGLTIGILTDDEGETERFFLADKLIEDRLLKKETFLRCAQQGHGLFRLSSPDMLIMLEKIHAKCKFCGGAVGNEKVEEVVTLTQPVSELIEDGWWLVTTLNSILSKCYVSKGQIAIGFTSCDEVQAMVNVYGEPFLFVLKDADLSLSDARRIVGKLHETMSAQLVVIVTGQIENDAETYLNEHAKRRMRNRSNGEIVLINDVAMAPTELQSILSKVALKRELERLNAGLGLPIWALVAASFNLKEPMVLKDIAVSAVRSLDLTF